MNKEITIDSDEFKEMYLEISEMALAKKKRKELTDDSFRRWICHAIEIFAEQIGYHIQNLYEFTLDMADSFKRGFKSGRERARQNSLRRNR